MKGPAADGKVDEAEAARGVSASRALLLCVAGATFLAYLPTAGHGFINFDDPYYVTGNEVVRRGLTLSGLRWGFAALENGNWHPLTWVSHMLDVELFGLRPAGHHLVSALLHAFNAGLLSLLLLRMTGGLWASVLTGLLFALHPLHVESVAWVSERKDLLSTLLGLAALLAYTRYARGRRRRDFAATALLFVLGLAAKPMLVTLPLLMLILDAWPLGRLRCERPLDLIREKAPLLACAAAAGSVALWAQHRAGAIGSTSDFPVLQRLADSLVAYATYAGKAFWPNPLAVFYPHENGMPPAGRLLAAIALLAAVTFLALRVRSRRPALLAGWLWFVVTLLPVIGLVQVGQQATADRYTYFPLTGLFVGLLWGLPGAAGLRRVPRIAAVAGAAAAVAALTFATERQLAQWRDSRTLFGHALASGVVSWRAHAHLATALTEEGRLAEAVAHYREAARLAPLVPHVHTNLGTLLLRLGQPEEALPHLEEAVRLAPDLAEAHYSLAAVLRRLGRWDEGLRHFRRALVLKPALGP